MGASLALAALAAAAVVLVSAPSAARAEGFPAGSETAAAGAVSATLSWETGVQDWRAFGFRLDDLDADGTPEIVARDVRFEGIFTSTEASFPPPAVFHHRFTDGTAWLQDVTSDHPDLIRRNAAQAKRLFKALPRGEPAGQGYVSAYVADQYLLGRGSVGLRELDRQIARGILGRPKAARAFRKRLLRFLHRYDYR